jgi:hypothetical protein
VTDLDQLVRDGVRHTAAGIPAADPAELADRLGRGRRARRRRVVRHRLAAAAGAMVLVAGALAGLGVFTDDHRAVQVAAPTGSSFTDLEPGWHDLDTGPLSGADGIEAQAWTGSELVVVVINESFQAYRGFAYDPGTAVWRELPPIPVPVNGRLGLVWTGSELVAVSAAALGPIDSEQAPTPRIDAAASWRPGEETWQDIGSPPVAAELESSVGLEGGPGQRADAHGIALVWTGQRVLDLTHGASWDPLTRTWATMRFPQQVVPYIHLLSSNPVWDGTEAVAVAWAEGPGLAWDALGSTVRQVPGIPADRVGKVASGGLATSVGGRVFLVPGSGAGPVMSLDARSGTWRDEAQVPGMVGSSGCPELLVTVGDRPVIAPCPGQPGVVLTDGEWVALPPNPGLVDQCCHVSWLDAGGVLVSWTRVADPGGNDPTAIERLHASVWVPG